ncbi:D-aminoacyl-tRNA deacylase [Mucisphaera calidilacus]|uniref:D-aminoacyl-tRNA deacylase n=1 Tax=Mucisphaera calidilacus TaxID=2527982 RepID=A0A518BYC4_9BACT|nr:D-aminoacyl-tRNA deacylase [Mucisphaera calidilacus]QDU71975.1 D-tyrosyl-tRNA(Tyr) deacylase [Mucisphaera calidilacus]
MRALIQRVRSASVAIDGKTTGAIQRGYAILLGVGHDDTPATAQRLADKIVNLRLFPDEQGRFDRSLLDINADALVVSQFTLYADARKGRRPSFLAAGKPPIAEPLCEHFCQCLRDLGVPSVQTGRFGADMLVSIENDGPVTLWLDSDELGISDNPPTKPE